MYRINYRPNLVKGVEDHLSSLRRLEGNSRPIFAPGKQIFPEDPNTAWIIIHLVGSSGKVVLLNTYKCGKDDKVIRT